MNCDLCERPAKVFYLRSKDKTSQLCGRHARNIHNKFVKKFRSVEERLAFILMESL